MTDLPIANRPVQIVIQARRFHCDAVICGRRIFAERFDKNVLAPWARRTARLDLTFYPYLPAATVGTTDPRAYLGLIAGSGSVSLAAGAQA